MNTNTKEIVLSKKISRFIVPFSFASEKKGLYEELMQVMADQSNQLWTPVDFSRKECDLYDFVKDSMEISARDAICHSFCMNANCKKKLLPNVVVSRKKEKGLFEKVAVKVTDVGLYLFEGGVGFLWYQLEAEVQSDLELIQLNNGIKEFAHYSGATQCYVSTIQNLPTGISAKDCQSISEGEELPQDVCVIVGKRGLKKYFDSSMLPDGWQHDKQYEYYEREGTVWARYTQEEEFRFVDWLMDLLQPIPVESFFASREETKDAEKRIVPDKAVLFNCVLTGQEVEHRIMQEHLFWLAKGYTSRYLLSDRYLNEENTYYLQPFDNITWFASEEGCAQMVNVSGEGVNKPFFQDTYWSRQDIYFYAYILVLQQYYSLLKVNWKLAQLPRNLKGYKKKHIRKQLKECKEEINFFFSNSVHLKISHISHQNMFYAYLCERYGLAEMTDKLKEKIDMLNDMVETWHQETKNKRMLALSIAGSAFVFIQTLNNVMGIYDFLPWKGNMNMGGFCLLVFGLAVLVSLIAAFIINRLGDE